MFAKLEGGISVRHYLQDESIRCEEHKNQSADAKPCNPSILVIVEPKKNINPRDEYRTNNHNCADTKSHRDAGG